MTGRMLLTEALPIAEEIVSELKKIGVIIAVDDFKESDIFPVIIVAVVMIIGMCFTYDYPQY